MQNAEPNSIARTPNRGSELARDLRRPEPRASSLPPAAAQPSRLWLWFVAAFVLQLGAWIAWFAIAARHPVEQVPLVSVPR